MDINSGVNKNLIELESKADPKVDSNQAPPPPPVGMARLPGLTRTLDDISKKREVLIKEHEEQLKSLDRYKTETAKKIDLIMKGINLEAIEEAESVLYVRGDYTKAGAEVSTVFARAIAWFSSPDPFVDPLFSPYNLLTNSYFGTKDYDRWHGQFVVCRYGLGPTHGHVIFEIGLKPKWRNPEVYASRMTEELKGYCIYYLRNYSEVAK